MATKQKLHARRNIGRLFVIGGNEDKDPNKMVILPHFLKLCGGKRARIVVCGTPSKEPTRKERVYRNLFEKIGASDVFEAQIKNRRDAENEEVVAAVRKATGVFFTGSDQLRLTSLIAGTAFGDSVRERLWNDRLVVGGTSAGAAAMSTTMVIGGRDDGSVRRCDVRLGPGLGYWRDTTIDTHFGQRGRMTRMFVIFSENPQVLGIGLDEDTAVEVTPGRSFTVVGKGAAFVFDGKVTHTSAPEADDDEIIAMTDSVVHVLPDGYRFDLVKMRPLLPSGKLITKRAG